MTRLTVSVTPVNLTAFFLWTAPADGSEAMIPVEIEGNNGSVELENGVPYHLYYRIIGAPLGNITIELKNPVGKSILKVDKSTIPVGDTDLIGAREFTS